MESTHPQLIYEDISESTYYRMLKKFEEVDLKKVVETEDITSLKEQAACAGNQCEIT